MATRRNDPAAKAGSSATHLRQVPEARVDPIKRKVITRVVNQLRRMDLSRIETVEFIIKLLSTSRPIPKDCKELSTVLQLVTSNRK